MKQATTEKLTEMLQSLEALLQSGKANPVVRVASQSQVKKIRQELAIRAAAELGKVS